MDETRRHFLRGGFLTRQGREKIRRLKQALGPLPPGFEGNLSQEVCGVCGHPCVPACEMDIIHIHPPEHTLKGLPYLNFEEGGCTFCQECVQSCPVIPKKKSQQSNKIGTASLDHATCLAWGGIVCMSCRFACTWRAVALDSRQRPAIDNETCTGCGMCVSVCPKQAIKINTPEGGADYEAHRSV